MVGWSAPRMMGEPSGGIWTAPWGVHWLGRRPSKGAGMDGPSSRRPMRSERLLTLNPADQKWSGAWKLSCWGPGMQRRMRVLRRAVRNASSASGVVSRGGGAAGVPRGMESPDLRGRPWRPPKRANRLVEREPRMQGMSRPPAMAR